MSETPQRSSILVLNCGSSSLKYAAFDGEEVLRRGAITRIGTGGAPDHGAAVHAVLEELSSAGLGTPSAVGHRLVHGGPLHAEPERVDDALTHHSRASCRSPRYICPRS